MGSGHLPDLGSPAAATRHGKTFGDIGLIVITHAHVDHAGDAARLRELSGAPIVAHRADLPHYTQQARMTFCPTGWCGRWFLKTGLISQPYRPFVPDILLEDADQLDLAPFGIAGQVIPTPGHTAGSMSIKMDSKQAMVGDLIASGVLLGALVRTGHACRPPFEDDARATADALTRLVDEGVEQFYLGHGGPLPATEVARHVQRLRALP